MAAPTKKARYDPPPTKDQNISLYGGSIVLENPHLEFCDPFTSMPAGLQVHARRWNRMVTLCGVAVGKSYPHRSLFWKKVCYNCQEKLGLRLRSTSVKLSRVGMRKQA